MGVGGCAGLVFYHSVTNLDESGRREHQLRKELLYEPICWSNAASAETEGWLQLCGEVGMLRVQRLVTLSWAIPYTFLKPHTNIL